MHSFSCFLLIGIRFFNLTYLFIYFYIVLLLEVDDVKWDLFVVNEKLVKEIIWSVDCC